MGYTVAPGVSVPSHRGVIYGSSSDARIWEALIVPRGRLRDPDALKAAEKTLAEMHAKGLLLKDGKKFEAAPPPKAKPSKPTEG